MSLDRPLRVVRLVPVLDFGGVESRIILQAASMDRGRFALRVCTLWTPGAAAHEIASLGIPVDVLGLRPDRSMRTVLALVRYLRRVRPDILHCSVTEANFLGLIAGLAAGVPVRIAEEVGMPNHGRQAQFAFRALYRTATAVIGVTQAVSDYLIEVDRAPPRTVRQIYNCAHPRYFPEVRPQLERTEAERRTFLLVGRLHPVKNHETLLRAFARVVAQRPSARLLIAGDGPLRGRIEELRNELDLLENSEMLGFRADVADLLRRTGAFMLGSHAEGCSISLIEAMATGLPALGSNVAGIREVMGDDLARNWTVEAADVEGWARMMLVYLDASPSERIELARRAQERAYTYFSPARYIRDLSDLYDELSPMHSRETPRHLVEAPTSRR